jgi:hypothetical protein
MLFSPLCAESHPRRSTVFVSRMGLRDAVGQIVCKLVPFQLMAARLRDTASLPPRIEASIRDLVQIVGMVLVTLGTPTDACIPFLFNHSSSHRLRRASTERCVSPLLSCPCGHFSFQQGGTPSPSIFLDCHSTRSPLFPAVHPISLQQFTKCSSSNHFVLITIHIHGGCTPSTRKS